MNCMGLCSQSAAKVTVPAENEHFVRIETPADAYRLVYPIRTKNPSRTSRLGGSISFLNWNTTLMKNGIRRMVYNCPE
jgi:hypothetical protein